MTDDLDELIRDFLAKGGEITKLRRGPRLTSQRPRQRGKMRWKKAKMLKPGGRLS